MFLPKNRHSILFKTITPVIVCLFLVDAIAFADSNALSPRVGNPDTYRDMLQEMQREYFLKGYIYLDNSTAPISELLTEAEMFSRFGPLDKAIGCLQQVLLRERSNKTALISLARIYEKLGRYEEALILLHQVSGSDESAKAAIAGIAKKKDALQEIDDLNKKGFEANVVPDGQGGYFVDTIGFEGKWIVTDKTGKAIDKSGYVLRLLKSIAIVAREARAGDFKYNSDIVNWNKEIALGRIYIVNKMEDIADIGTGRGAQTRYYISHDDDPKHPKVCVEVVSGDNGKREIIIYVTPDFPRKGRFTQRNKLKDIFKTGKTYEISSAATLEKAEEQKISAGKEFTNDNMALISLSNTSNEGINLLGQLLEKDGAAVDYNYLEDEQLDTIMSGRDIGIDYSGMESDEEIIKEYGLTFWGAITRIKKKGTKLIGISVTASMLRKTDILINAIRKEIPEAIIIIGGPATHTPEQLAAILPKADVLVRGEADQVFPALFKILKGHNALTDLSEDQIGAISKLSGGVFVRSGQHFIVNNLHDTNIVEKFHLAEPRDPERDNVLFTSRGCPYKCAFCNLVFGRKFRAVDNSEVIDWMIKRLALEFPSEDPAEVRALLERGENLYEHGFRRPLRVEIWDDNFFADKERIKSLSREIDILGLNRYYLFAVQGGSNRAIYKDGSIDRDLVDALWKGGFREIKFGTDGLSNAVLKQNKKGYTFAMPMAVNKYLSERGFFVRHNFIFSTPKALRSELIENVVLLSAFPKGGVGTENSGILGGAGTEFDNLDVLNYSGEYCWPDMVNPNNIITADYHGYIVPLQPEYVLRKNRLLNIADPITSDLSNTLLKRRGMALDKIFTNIDITRKDIEGLILRWQRQDDPELKALAEILSMSMEDNDEVMLARIRNMREELTALGIYSFVEYIDFIKKKKAVTYEECMANGKIYIEQGLLGKAFKAFYRAERLQPHNPEAYYAEAAVNLMRSDYGNVSDTVIECINNSNINVPVFFADRSSIFKVLIFRRILNEFCGVNSQSYAACLHTPIRLELQTEDVIKDFGAGIDIVIRNIRKYAEYFKGGAFPVITEPLTPPLAAEQKMKELREFSEGPMIEYLGDNNNVLERHIYTTQIRIMNMQVNMFGGSGNIESVIGEAYGEDAKDPSKIITTPLATVYMKGMEDNEFIEEMNKRIYEVGPSYLRAGILERNDILCSSISGAAYAIIRGNKDGKTYYGLANFYSIMDSYERYNISPILRMKLENPEVILVAGGDGEGVAGWIMKDLAGNGISCEYIRIGRDQSNTDSYSHMAVSVDTTGYAIVDRATEGAEQTIVKLWKDPLSQMASIDNERAKTEEMNKNLEEALKARTHDKAVIKVWSGYAKSNDQKAILQEIRKIAPGKGYEVDFGNISEEEDSLKELVDFAVSQAGKNDNTVTILPSNHSYVQANMEELKKSHVIFMDYDSDSVDLDSFFQIGGIIAAGVAYLNNNDLAFMNLYRLLTDDNNHVTVTIDQLKKDPLALRFFLTPIRIKDPNDLKSLNDRMRELLIAA